MGERIPGALRVRRRVAQAVAMALVATMLPTFPPPVRTVAAASTSLPGTFTAHDFGAGGNPSAVAMTPDGDRFRLTDIPISGSWQEYTPALSPDGTQVALSVSCNGGALDCGTSGLALAVAEVGGTAPLWTMGMDDAAGPPSWSPDGSTIALSTRTAWGEPFIVVLVAADGSSRTTLASFDAYDPPQVWFDATGDRIAVAYGNGTGRHLASVDVASGTVTDLGVAGGYAVGWSADGTALLWGENGSGPTGALFRLKARPVAGGPDQLVLERSGFATLYAISPDGEWFVTTSVVSGVQQWRAARVDGTVTPVVLPGSVLGWSSAVVLPPPVDPPDAYGFAADALVALGTPAGFEAESPDGSADGIEVDWGDGVVEVLALPAARLEHVYAAVGTYDAVATPVGRGGRGTPFGFTFAVADLHLVVAPATVHPGTPVSVDLSGSVLPAGFAIGSLQLYGPTEVSPSTASGDEVEVTFDGWGSGDLAVIAEILDDTGATRGQLSVAAPIRVVIPADAPGGVLTSFGGDLYVHPDASPSRAVTVDGAGDTDARFDETGWRIVFVRDGDLWTAAIDGTELQRLTTTPEIERSPDLHGDTLLYLREGGTLPAALVTAPLADPVGGAVPMALGVAASTVEVAEFSGDGSRVEFTDGVTLRSVPVAGGSSTVRATAPVGDNFVRPDWSWGGDLVVVDTGHDISWIDLRNGATDVVVEEAPVGTSHPVVAGDFATVAWTDGAVWRTVGLDGSGAETRGQATGVWDWWKAPATDPPTPAPRPRPDVRPRLVVPTTVTLEPTGGIPLPVDAAVENVGTAEAPSTVAVVTWSGPVTVTLDLPGCTAGPLEVRCDLGMVAAGASVPLPVAATVTGEGTVTIGLEVSTTATQAGTGDDAVSRTVTASRRVIEPSGTVVVAIGQGTSSKVHGVVPGAAPVRLTTTGADIVEYGGSLSDDGTQVAVVYAIRGRYSWRGIGIFDVGAPEPHTVLEVGNGDGDQVDWSADGRSLLVHGRGLTVRSFDVATGTASVLATSENFTDAAYAHHSDDVVASLCEWDATADRQRCRIEVIDGQTGERRVLVADETDRALVEFSSDDQTVYFVRWVGGLGRTILAVPASGGPVRTTNLRTDEQFATAPIDGFVAVTGSDLMPESGYGWVAATDEDPGTAEVRLVDNEQWDVFTRVVPLDWSRAEVSPHVVTVTGGSDDPIDDGCNPAPGDCTLAEAIEDNNDETDPTRYTTIVVPPGTVVTGPLPTITRPVTIVGDRPVAPTGDGRDPLADPSATECGSTPTYVLGDGTGTSVGLRIAVGRTATRTTLIRGLVIASHGGDGVRVQDSAKVRFRCTSVGTPGYEIAGVGRLGGNGGDGFDVRDSTDVVLFASVAAQANRGDGLEITGRSSGVRALGTSFFDDGGLGIDLGPDGIDPSDAGDGDDGPNTLLNRPRILRVVPGTSGREVVYVGVSHAPTTEPFRVDVFLNAWCDPSGSGESMAWLGTGTFANGSPASGVVRVELPFTVPDRLVTASVTTRDGTSELAGCLHADANGDPDLDTTTAGTPTGTVVAPTNPTGGGGDTTADPGGVGDGLGGGRPPADVVDDGSPGGADPGLGGPGPSTDQPTPDTVPAVDGYVVVGQEGEIVVDRPGLLDGIAGDGPLQAYAVPGGDMPPGAWKLAADGVVTVDGRAVSAGSYAGRYRIVDRDGDRSEPATILFLVLAADGSIPVAADLPVRARPRPDEYVVAPGQTLAGPSVASVLDNDFPGDESGLTAELADSGRLSGRISLDAEGRPTVDAAGLAEGTYVAAYRLLAGGESRGVVTISVIVDDGNTCPSGVPDHYDVRAGELFVAAGALGVLGNDTDPEGDDIRADLVGTFSRSDISLATDGTVTLDARTAGPGQHREFEYEPRDASGTTCGPVLVTIDVVAGQPPTANLDYFEVYAGQAFDLPARGILGNDFDPDGSDLALIAALVSAPKAWKVKVGKDGAVSASVPAGTPLDTVVSTTYRITDDLGQTADGELRFRVVRRGEETKIPSVPVAVDDLHYRVHAGDTLVVGPDDGVLANDSPSDPDLVYAESTTEESNGARFTIGRNGGFTLHTSLSDAGTTLSQTYYVIRRGYAGVISKKAARVEIEVVPPRVRCTTGEAGLILQGGDGTTAPSDLLTATAPYGWCWDRTAVTDAWFAGGDEPFVEDRSTALAVADEVFFGWTIRLHDERGYLDVGSGRGMRAMTMTNRYEMCIDALDFVPFVFRGLQAAAKSKVVGSAIKYLTKKAGGGAALLDDLLDALRWIDNAIDEAGILADWIRREVERIPFVGKLIGRGISAIEGTGWRGVLESSIELLKNTAVRVGFGGTVESLTIPEMLDRWISDDVDDLTEFDVVAQPDGPVTCQLLSSIWSGYDDAVGTTAFGVRADGTAGVRPGTYGPFGFMDWWIRFVWIFDPTRNGDPVPSWVPVPPGTDQTAYLTCDFTRVRSGQQPVPGTGVAARPAADCNDPRSRG